MTEERCRNMHSLEVWPYVSRCVLERGHGTKHKDKYNLEWEAPEEDDD